MDKNQISAMLDSVDKYPFHMPGHKRNTVLTGENFPYSRDITEIAGSDNLHDMSGVIKAECDRAARLWGAVGAHILVGGSTCGILAAIRAYAGHDRPVIMARNAHKSVYNGIELCRLQPIYLYPEIDSESGICGSITPAQVDLALSQAPGAKLVILTSPTYEGVISDIAGICRVAHAKGALVLVDAAHGAHLGLGDFAPNPVTQGADVTICSLHKTLPAPTQTAVALIGKTCPNAKALATQLAVFETSSPSYVLMEQAAACIRMMEQKHGELCANWLQRLADFEKATVGLQHLHLCFRGALPACVWGYDPGKLVISTKNTDLSGHGLAQLLRNDYKIEVEMAASDYVIAMTSLADTDTGFERLADALCRIDAQLKSQESIAAAALPLLHVEYAPWQVADLPSQNVSVMQAAGCVMAEYVWAYPPGIPLVVPGERLHADVPEVLANLAQRGTELHSTSGNLPHTLCVVKE